MSTRALLLGSLLAAGTLAADGQDHGRNVRGHASNRSEAGKLVREYFASGADRKAILKKLRALDPIPDRELRRWTSEVLQLARRHGPKLKEAGGVLDHPEFKGRYLVKMPPGGARARSPLVIGLHGGGQGGGNPAWAQRNYGFMVDQGGCIGVFPQVLEKKYAEWAGNPKEAEYVKEILDAALRTWSIDTNRIYMIGDSMGGYGTWHIGGYMADRFAALSSHAGGILGGQGPWGQGILANLRNTPIYFTHGAKDQPAPVDADRMADRWLKRAHQEDPKGYKHVYVEFPNRGHSLSYDELKKAMTWCLRIKRDPVPKRIVWEPRFGWKNVFAWISIDDPKPGQRIEAEIQGNRITVTTNNVAAFSILLNQKLVNLRKEVTVVVDGEEKFKGAPTASLSAIVESVAAHLDPERIYTHRIDVGP